MREKGFIYIYDKPMLGTVLTTSSMSTTHILESGTHYCNNPDMFLALNQEILDDPSTKLN